MKQQFDQAAPGYDEEFTWSAIGIKLRNIVRNYLQAIILPDQKMKILELNCGTGEDAIFLARQGHTIVGIDISEEMIAVANQKVQNNHIRGNLSFLTMDMRNLSQRLNESGFDLVFSNFGGLNCLNDLENIELSHALPRFLKPGGRFISVIMGKYCLWESIYFLLKGDLNKVFRRSRSKGVQVSVSGQLVDTWYFTPHEFQVLYKTDFRRMGLYPLGFFLPPSYLNHFFDKHPGFLNTLNRMEFLITGIPALAQLSDHFILDLETN